MVALGSRRTHPVRRIGRLRDHRRASATHVPAPPAAPGLQLAAQLRSALEGETAVATTTYIPSDGLFIYTHLPDGNPDEVRIWAGSYLAPLAVQLAEMPADERLRWVIETGQPPNYQEVVTASLHESFQMINFESQISALSSTENTVSVVEPTSVPQTEIVTIVVTSTPEPPAEPTIAPTAIPTASEQIITSTIVEFVEPAGTVTTLLSDTVLSEQIDVWQTVQGEWIVDNGSVIQTETGQYDRIALYRAAWMRPPYSLGANVRVDEGEMGAGLVFNAQSVTDKTRAQMVSFTADGDYLQWGYFDDDGLFTFQNGTFVTGIIEGRDTHTIRVEVGNETYSVTLNGVQLTDNTPLVYPRGYVGLFANLSVTAFEGITLIGEAITPE